MMSLKALSVKYLRGHQLLNLNQGLATRYFPGLIIALSLLSFIFLSTNPAAHSLAFSSITQSHSYLLLEGALISFSLFALLLAIYKKNSFFLIIFAWILCNLYLGAAALGSNHFWLQFQIPTDIVTRINPLVIGMYFILSQQLLQHGLALSAAENKNNYRLAILSLVVFLLSFYPDPALFSMVLMVAIPLALALGLTISIQQLLSERVNLLSWHVVLLSILISASCSYILDIFITDYSLLHHFNAFIFLILCNGMVVFGVVERMKLTRATQLELRSIYQNSSFYILKIDFLGNVLKSNHAFERLCAKIEQPKILIWSALFPDQNWKHIVQRTLAGHYTEIQFNIARPHNAFNPLFALHANHVHEGYLLTLQDITPYMNTLNRFKAMADNDPVTQVLNQRGLEKALQYTITNLEHNHPCFLAYLDVNHVNYVNRTYGHAAGDSLIQEVSQRINAILQQRYSFGRLSSDDFVFLLNNTNTQTAQKIAAKVTKALNNAPIQTPFREYQLNVHLGLIEIGTTMDEQTALRTAQSACADAQRQGVDFLLYENNSAEMQYRTEELRLFENLENGATRSLFVEMQPLLNLADPLAHYNIEILLRVRRENGDLIPLHTFIPAAEENGTISIIDKWVFLVTLEWLDVNQLHLKHINQVNINLSGYSLNNDKFMNELFIILDQYEHLLDKLCIEITEGVALQDLARTREFMQNLHAKGVRIALDDFGAGYTSFSYLRELPANSIKIDGALIQDMLSKESNIAIVRTITELARNLGMLCIAEWVEDVETLVTLKKMGVNYAQGFCISAARSPEEILQAKDIRALIKDPAIIGFTQEIHRDKN